ncbi:MAG: tetratricopeptide repeat protein [Dehalococcoidales bacterium]|nr:tetratricopeptide repeat protein [Dehalococcoidales bacterium]
METRNFGERLKEIRKQAGLSQRVLADKVGVNFSYLSKIENGTLPAPSDKVISRLAEVLDTDKDELMLLAGKIPADIAQMLREREAWQLLRSASTQGKKRRAIAEKKEGGIMSLFSFKSLARVAIAIVLVTAAGALFWFASPVADTAVAANSRGISYNDGGEYEKALVAFNKAIELDPTFALAYSNRGWVHIKLGEYEKAIVDSSRAIELNPELAIAYNIRGWAYTESGKYEEAIADYNKALELDPNLGGNEQ